MAQDGEGLIGLAPRTATELLGQGRAEQVLLDAWLSGRLPHAWLLTGPQGVGKATLAYRFARFLLSQSGDATIGNNLFNEPAAPKNLYSDPLSKTFKLVSAESHPDLRVLQRQFDKSGRLRNSIIVDDVRAATEFLHRTAGEGGWRVLIVDAAEDMNIQATNALLKELEEPNDRAVLLLISHAPGRLLPTVHSRCCHLSLRPLPDVDVERLLIRLAPEASPEEVQALVRLCEGSIGRAITLHQSGGLSLFQQMMDVLSSLPRLDILKAQAFAEVLSHPKETGAFETFRNLISWWIGRLLHGGASGTYPPPVLAGEEELMIRLYQRASLDRWMEFCDKWTHQLARADNTAPNRRQMTLAFFSDFSRLLT